LCNAFVGMNVTHQQNHRVSCVTNVTRATHMTHNNRSQLFTGMLHMLHVLHALKCVAKYVQKKRCFDVKLIFVSRGLKCLKREKRSYQKESYGGRKITSA
jgi:hypothetical protein